MSKTGSSFTVIALTLMLLASPIFAQSRFEIAGNWDFTVTATEGERQAVVTFKKVGDTFSGCLNTQRGEVAFEDLVLRGENISFNLRMPIRGQESLLTFKGTVQGDSMQGDADLSTYGKGTWSAKKQAAVNAAAPSENNPIAGSWKFDFETPNGVQTGDVTFRMQDNRCTGMGKSSLGDFPVTCSLQKEEVLLEFEVNYRGEPMKIRCTGKLDKEGAMTGTYTYNDMGPSPWTAKKAK